MAASVCAACMLRRWEARTMRYNLITDTDFEICNEQFARWFAEHRDAVAKQNIRKMIATL